jgi:hypothetical protein
MAVEGTLQEVSLPTLVQVVLQEGGHGCLRLENDTQIGWLYLAGGRVCHAALAEKKQAGLIVRSGEEVVYELLRWSDGRFIIEHNIPPPDQTIEQSWDFILMEGLRKLDERWATEEEKSEELPEFLTSLSETEAAVIQEIVAQQKEKNNMTNLNQTLESVMKINGAVAAALVDWESGLTLGTIGNGINIDLAAAGNTNVVRSKLSVMKDLKLKGTIEDILITLTEQYHLIRLLEHNPNLFLYVALDRSISNLGMARHQLNSLEKELTI